MTAQKTAPAMTAQKRSLPSLRERSDEAIHSFFPRRRWIASLALAMTAQKTAPAMTAQKRSFPSLREAKRRSNSFFPSATAMDCFAGARNDGKKAGRQSLLPKISLAPSGKSPALVRAVPRSSRGALRGRHERWARDAMDALRCAGRATLRSGRRSRVVLIPRRWYQVGEMRFASRPATGARKPGPREATV